ncbi:MAG: hypothetical protein WC641_08570 [Patescibacteria group bacterium]
MKIPAIEITVLNFRLTPQDARKIRQGRKDLLLAHKPPEMDQEKYLDSLTRRLPAGATVFLGSGEQTVKLNGENEIVAERFPLLLHENGRYFLLFTEDMQGEVDLCGDVRRLDELYDRCDIDLCSFGAVYAADLSDCARGVLNFGECTVCFEITNPLESFDLSALLDGRDFVPPVTQVTYAQGLRRLRLEQERRAAAACQAEITALGKKIADLKAQERKLLGQPVRHLNEATQFERDLMERDHMDRIKAVRSEIAENEAGLVKLHQALVGPSEAAAAAPRSLSEADDDSATAPNSPADGGSISPYASSHPPSSH